MLKKKMTKVLTGVLVLSMLSGCGSASKMAMESAYDTTASNYSAAGGVYYDSGDQDHILCCSCRLQRATELRRDANADHRNIFFYRFFKHLIKILYRRHGCLREHIRMIHHLLIKIAYCDLFYLFIIVFPVKRNIKGNNLNILFFG